MMHILETLQFTLQKDGDTITATVPSYRGDCTEMPDIAEEVARIYGYENIPSTRPWSDITVGEPGLEYDVTEKISRILCSSGLNETVTFSFMHPDQLKKLLYKEGDPVYQAVPIINPITEDFPLMRTTLIPSLMDVLVPTRRSGIRLSGIYEIAPVYIPKELPVKELPEQKLCVSGLLYGQRTAGGMACTGIKLWISTTSKPCRSDSFGLGIHADIEVSDYAPLHPGKAARYVKDGKVLCNFGEVHPKAIDNYDVTGPVYIFEMYMDAIMPFINLMPDYHKVAKFPASSRTPAFLAPVGTSNQAVLDIIREKAENIWKRFISLICIRANRFPEDTRVWPYNLVFRSEQGTLTDQDIQAPIDAILSDLKEKLNCELR